MKIRFPLILAIVSFFTPVLVAETPSNAEPKIGIQVEKEVPVPNKVETTEQTLAIIKPDAVSNEYIGEIISRYEEMGFKIVGLKMVKLSKEQAGKFYAEHKERPFYGELVDFMSSGPIVVLVLGGKNAITENRKLMGATDPAKAEEGTLRADFGESMGKNAVHGSDSKDAAKREIDFFFQPNELVNIK